MKKEIFVKDLLYPTSLGQGNEISCKDIYELHCGCPVINHLIKIGEMSELHDRDNIDSDKNYWELDTVVKKKISSLSEEQKELCHASLLCGPIIKKMINGDYKYNDPDIYNNIRVTFIKKNNSYFPHEGKHRACMAKNFLPSTATIPVELE